MRAPTLDDRLRWLMYAAFEEGNASARRSPADEEREDHFRKRAEFEAQQIRDLFAARSPE